MNKAIGFSVFILAFFFVINCVQLGTITTQMYISGYGIPTELTLTLTNFVISLLSGIITFVVLAGIKIFDSGLSDETIALIQEIVVYATIWSSLSSLCYTSLTSIPFLGVFFYIILTLIYAYGCVVEIRSD